MARNLYILQQLCLFSVFFFFFLFSPLYNRVLCIGKCQKGAREIIFNNPKALFDVQDVISFFCQSFLSVVTSVGFSRYLIIIIIGFSLGDLKWIRVFLIGLEVMEDFDWPVLNFCRSYWVIWLDNAVAQSSHSVQ